MAFLSTVLTAWLLNQGSLQCQTLYNTTLLMLAVYKMSFFFWHYKGYIVLDLESKPLFQIQYLTFNTITVEFSETLYQAQCKY